MIQNRVEISPEAPATRHFHPGEEAIYVLEGTIKYEVDGEPAQMVQTGEVLTVAAERVHSAKNIGSGASGQTTAWAPKSFWRSAGANASPRSARPRITASAVFNGWALLAFLADEPAAERIGSELLDGQHVSRGDRSDALRLQARSS